MFKNQSKAKTSQNAHGSLVINPGFANKGNVLKVTVALTAIPERGAEFVSSFVSAQVVRI